MHIRFSPDEEPRDEARDNEKRAAERTLEALLTAVHKRRPDVKRVTVRFRNQVRLLIEMPD